MRIPLPAQSVLEAMGLKPIPLFTLSAWIKAAMKCGFNVQPVFEQAGIRVDLARLEDGRVPPFQLLSVLEQSVAMSRDQYFPLVLGDTFAFESLPEVETLLTTSPSIRDALRAAHLARMVVLPWLAITLSEENDIARVVVGLDVPVQKLVSSVLPVHLVIHATLACIRKFGRSLIGSEESFLGVELVGPPTEHADQIRAFFGVPVTFNAPHNALLLRRSVLDQPLEGAFPALHEQAQQLAEQRLGREARRHGVAAEIEVMLERHPELLTLGVDEMGDRLNMHPRTLQRRLKEEGKSYLGVQAHMRHRLACMWLAQRDVSIDEVSNRLGFSDRRAFTAAFKRWEGCTPSAWRDQAV